jgi:hypothetical protein
MWELRQRTDGLVAAVLVVVSVIPVLRFLLSPAPVPAGVMGVFLLALGIACVRLLRSAAMVVRIRNSLYRPFAPEIIEAEVLDAFDGRG